MARPALVNGVLDGHVSLDVECLDRINLNGCVPNPQVPGQVVVFLTRHLGFPIPTPAPFDRIGTRFRRVVARYARANDIPVAAVDAPVEVSGAIMFDAPGTAGRSTKAPPAGPDVTVNALYQRSRSSHERCCARWRLVASAFLLVGLTAIAVGYAIAYALPPAATTLTSQVLVFFVLMFSPINFPADGLPEWLQALHRILPVQSMAQVVRETLVVPASGIDSTPFALLVAQLG